jgi:hypothetical protein
MIIRFLSAFLVASSLYLFTRENSLDWQSWFAWHPTSMIISFFGFLPEVLLASAKFKQNKLEKKGNDALVQQHATMALLCKAFALLGFGAIYVNKELNGRPHFTTIHGQLGAATMFVLFVQVVLGILQNEFFLHRIISVQTRVLVRKIHFYLSALLILVVTGAMWHGFQTTYFQKFVLKEDPKLMWVSWVFGGAIPALAILSFVL